AHMKELNLTTVTALSPCTGVFARTMGMPCAHIIQPLLVTDDSLAPEHFRSQWYLEGHSHLEPVDYRLWVQNPERIRPRGRPGTHQQMTDRSTLRVPSGFEAIEAELHKGESSQRGRV
ncbi:hypothetical protein V1509DRAFT_636235, partial [Lipomyces kononenkoae]